MSSDTDVRDGIFNTTDYKNHREYYGKIERSRYREVLEDINRHEEWEGNKSASELKYYPNFYMALSVASVITQISKSSNGVDHSIKYNRPLSVFLRS